MKAIQKAYGFKKNSKPWNEQSRMRSPVEKMGWTEFWNDTDKMKNIEEENYS